ncbi:FtsX-like permease family protein [Rhizohabitans arisaemae]|uniref:ABC transporter permease n=1 Tax=Rhizohabitans arisaemae TaxID=2720610 RepID=UPI0024B0E180|nr:FtsX-like permease family protein [Rhizohabitans arisaemae]
MSAVWRAARAALRRRKVQSAALGIVVFSSTLAAMVSLGLIEASSGPFDRAFARQHGAHVTAVFDPAAVSAAQLARTARRPGVQAVAGPFGQTTLTVPDGDPNLAPGPLTVVGRGDPGGPVDRINLWAGRWATRPGEIVLNRPDDPPIFGQDLGLALTFTGGSTFTVVGLASTVSQTAQAWVSPGQMAALRPASLQVLYRFTDAATDTRIRTGLATAVADLPAGSLLAAQSSLTLKRDHGRGASAYLPFLAAFGILALVVAILIVSHVVSGAVVAGWRNIGVLKSLGFTPNQVVSVYLAMVLVPTVIASLAAVAVGGLAAHPLLRTVSQGVGDADLATGLSPWVYAVTLPGVPAVVILAALIPALRAHRLPAALAIGAGGASRTGRGRRVQRRLSGARLPRSVSLGLGLPFARPARSLMTLTAVALGVTAVTLATGLSSTMIAYGQASQRAGLVHTLIHAGQPHTGQTVPQHGDAEIETLLRGLPGAHHVTAVTWMELHLAGYPQPVRAQFLRGDWAATSQTVIHGRRPTGPGEAVATSPFLDKRGLRIGDRLTVTHNGTQTPLVIVGQTMDGHPDMIQADWRTLSGLAPDRKATQYEVRLTPGTDIGTYNNAVKTADPGLFPSAAPQVNTDTVAVIGAATTLTLLLGTVAALGVFNTVVLTTRERRRDLGMLKSIGMTPRQVTTMVVTSMAALGTAGGLLGIPVGVVAHHLTIVAMTGAAGIVLPPSMTDVWHIPALALLVTAGALIAVLGALIPARSAARLTIATVLHGE